MKKSDYFYSIFNFTAEEKNLLTLAFLPLVDGFFIAFISNNSWQDILQVITFGLSAFSGAGCIILAMKLDGSIFFKMLKLAKIYLIVILGATIITIASPIFISILPDNMNLFTGIFLIGLALAISGIPFLDKLPNIIGSQKIVLLILLASLINGLISGINIQFTVEEVIIERVCFAVLIGFCLSVAGMLVGSILKKALNRKPLDLGAGASLFLMGTKMLGINISSVLILLPLFIGILMTIAVLQLKK